MKLLLRRSLSVEKQLEEVVLLQQLPAEQKSSGRNLEIGEVAAAVVEVAVVVVEAAEVLEPASEFLLAAELSERRACRWGRSAVAETTT